MELTVERKPRKPSCRAINEDDARFIAAQVARGHTETSACNLLGKFKPQRWFDWKTKGKRTAKINDLLSRTTAARMDNLIDAVETAALPEKAKAAKVRFDWRASQMLDGLHDDRFRNAPQAGTTTHQTAIIIGAGGEKSVLKMLDAIYNQAKTMKRLESTQAIDEQNVASVP